MKRIAILSDTHSCVDDRWAQYIAPCHEVWHAGDVGDMRVVRYLESLCPVVRGVVGNIDHGDVCRRFTDREIFTIEGVNVWLGHIGGYPGRYAPGVRQSLVDNRIRLMVAGHSHILKVVNDPQLGLLHINPGAAGYHGWQRVRTLVRLVIDAGTMRDLEVIEFGRRSINKNSTL